MLRVPREPDPIESPDNKGILLPDSLDFGELKKLSSTESFAEAISSHVESSVRLGMWITDVVSEPCADHVQHFKTVKLPAKGSCGALEIRIDYVKVAGVLDENLIGVRHTVELPINPYVYFDALTRLSYTDLIDKYTYKVELHEEIQTPKAAWCHVEHTMDHIGILLSDRDLVCFDFVSNEHLLVCSRSCIHPDCPPTEPPTFCCSGNKIYRMPLMYFQLVVPHSKDPERCKVVQFQYSDVGGIVPPEQQTKAVVQFGIDNIPKVVETALQAIEQKVDLGQKSAGYLQNPLKPSWRQSAKDMLPVPSWPQMIAQ